MTRPHASSLQSQQKKIEKFREALNRDRPHETIGMKRPGEIYQASERRLPKRIETYDYPLHF